MNQGARDANAENDRRHDEAHQERVEKMLAQILDVLVVIIRRTEPVMQRTEPEPKEIT